MGTVLIYLNSVARGGATAFPELGLSIAPEEGLAVVFFPCTAGGAGRGGGRGEPGRPSTLSLIPSPPPSFPSHRQTACWIARRSTLLPRPSTKSGSRRSGCGRRGTTPASSAATDAAALSVGAAGRSECTSNARVGGVVWSWGCWP